MANKDLFKQAIADAKSIREAAIANAKAALEESITPELKELLAARLQEMEEEVEEEVIAEEGVTENLEGVEEVIDEADEEEAEDDSEESEDEADEEEDAEGEEPAGDDEIADTDMTVDDLKDMIRDILSQEMGDHEEEDAMEDDMEAEDMASADMTAADDEEINLEELMAELAEMSKDEEVIAEEDHKEEAHEEVHEGEVEEGDYMEEEVIDEGFMDMMKKIYNDPEVLGKLITVDGKKMSLKDFLAMAGGATAGSMAGGGAPSSTKTPGSGVAEADLNEALETIETLQKELNETNLLNAKLLYVNKVFKANSLSEGQKANVIAAFDKAETVKEVKLVFETVSENIPSGGKKEVVRENKGFASAATGMSTKPEVITEANQAVLRMQKLAGIIK
jgi:hypothetical protein